MRRDWIKADGEALFDEERCSERTDGAAYVSHLRGITYTAHLRGPHRYGAKMRDGGYATEDAAQRAAERNLKRALKRDGEDA